MTKLEIVRELDRIARDANAVWNRCESLKAKIAEDAGISRVLMEREGIFVPEDQP